MLLFVCRANHCRSAMAERLAAWHGFAAESAGTHAVPGLEMAGNAQTALRGFGADPAGFRSRRLTPALLARPDLVLAATRAERAACVTLAPAAAGRTFTLLQYGRYLAALPPGDDPFDRAALSRVRGRLQPAAPGDDDLADPIGGPLDGFRDCADTINRILSLLAARR
ncbi:low molecular weight phosphatase family protein [Dactylosporangium sp. AC04546]|uniref:arsenate reductase/protein-tyrosine-phosphatase family protein n=1 Tax=Dactylosporangium sp. AC04546 TaxID=2862460 RepID=UPI001EE08358|nr:low molecular weight phosphatase family protein [Dactylosporangium sp. AC04546]WVK84341.1 low molecular weight phosphatase family protein [Dactylosporangium sp. AC04546]